MRLANFLFCLFAVLVCNASHSIPAGYVGSHLGINDGLSDNFVTAIVEDSRGFLWIGTENGVCRFDGEHFKSFSEKNTPLTGNSVNTIYYEPENDRIWIGTKLGLSVLDCRTQTFLPLKVPKDAALYNVTSIIRASDGGIWIANLYENILHYNPAKEEWKVFNPKNVKGLYPNFRTLYDDGRGSLFLGHGEHGMSIVQLANRKLLTFTHEENNPKSIPGDNVNSIISDRFGNIWVGTESGLALFNRESGDFTSFRHNKNNPSSLVSDKIYTLREMADSTLWIGCEMGGISVLDIPSLNLSAPEGVNFRTLPLFLDSPASLAASVKSIYQDRFGNIWIGNYSDGLDYLRQSRPVFSLVSRDTGPALAFAITKLSDGRMWIGGEKSLYLCDQGGREIKRIDLSGYLSNAHERIGMVLPDGDSLFVSFMGEGLFRVNAATGAAVKVDASKDMGPFYCGVRTPRGEMLLGRFDGIYQYADGKAVRRMDLSEKINHLTVHSMLVDRQGKLWVGTFGDGVFIFSPGGKLLSHLGGKGKRFPNSVKQMILDSRGWVWIGGQTGIARVEDTSRPERYTMFRYEAGIDNVYISSIAEDNDGSVWFATNGGLTRWNRRSGRFENFDHRHGITQSAFFDRAAAPLSNGSLLLGSSGGLCLMDPSALPAGKDGLSVRIVECEDVSAAKSKDSNGIIPIDPEKGLTIDFDRNSIRIIFSVADFSKSGLVEYSYMVEGFDKEWISTGDEHQAILRNLPPGKYVIRVRARLSNQEWTDAAETSVPLTVKPPVWLTWWAIAIYVAIACALVWMLVKLYKRHLQERNTFELERRKRIDQQELNNERLRFYTNITHELRTPLTLILGPLEDLTTDASLAEAHKGRIRTIHASALRLLNLINQILDFRKTETQNRKLTVSKGNIANLVTETGLRFKELNRNQKVRFEIDVDKDVPSVYFDSDMLTTILTNLLSNAVKYTPEGVIGLSLRQQERGGEKYIDICVSDTGYGIDAKSLPHIFDRYYQAEGKHQASGTGIGLALVKSLCELHGATLGVESEPGQGTRFRISLLAENTYPDALHKEAEPEKGREEDAEESEDEKLPLVLVVEDNADIRDYIESSLSGHYRIDVASDGKEGLEKALGETPDIVVTDVMMPVMDGMELCRRLKGDLRTSHVPVVLLTAKDSLADKETGYSAGADSYLTKPFSAKLLSSRIHNLLESRRLLRRSIAPHAKETPLPPPQPEAEGPAGQEAAAVGAHPLKLSKLDEKFIEKFVKIVGENINSPELDMTFMQESLHMSHSTLYRKIKGLTGLSGNELIRKIKLKKGYELLEEGHNVSEAAYSCGFNDVGYFRNCFKDEYGMSPSQFVKSLRGQ